jgi:hypothetical protein
MKATGKTQSCLVCLKKELERGSTTLVDMRTTKKNREESDEAGEKSYGGDPI